MDVIVNQEILTILKTVLVLMGTCFGVTLLLLSGLVIAFFLIRAQKKKFISLISALNKYMKSNRSMIEGLDHSVDKLLSEFLKQGDARIKIKAFAEKLGVNWMDDI